MDYAPALDRPSVSYLSRDYLLAPTEEDFGGAEEWFDDRLDVSRRVIPQVINVGRTNYPLRSTCIGSFHPGKDGVEGEFCVPEFGYEFIGRGGNVDVAYIAWRDQLHCRFQTLFAKRPFEMTQKEKETWRALERVIDVTVYRNSTPLSVKQVGKVGARVRPLPELIEWEDGHKEQVRLDQMPGEFVTYKPGQPFEAIVNRDPVDFHLLEVTHIRRINSLPRMNPEEFDELLRAIPTTGSLPSADWD